MPEEATKVATQVATQVRSTLTRRDNRKMQRGGGENESSLLSLREEVVRLQAELKAEKELQQKREASERQEKEASESQESQVKSFIDSIKVSDDNISQLKNKRRELSANDSSEKEQIESKCDEFQAKIDNDIESLRKIDSNAAKKIKDQRELQTLQSFKKRAQQKIQILTNKNKEAQDARKVLQLDLESRNTLLESERVQNNLLQQEKGNLEKTLRATQSSLEDKNRENIELNTQLLEARRSIEDASELNNSLSESLEVEKNDKGILQEELSSNAELLRVAQGQNSSLQQDQRNLEVNLRTTKSDLETANKKIELLNKGFDKFAKANSEKESLKAWRKEAKIVIDQAKRGDDLISSLTGIITNFRNLEEHVFSESIQDISEIQNCQELQTFNSSIKDLGKKIKALSPSMDTETINTLLNDLGEELIFSLYSQQLSLSTRDLANKLSDDVVQIINNDNILVHEYTENEYSAIGKKIITFQVKKICLPEKQIDLDQLLNSLKSALSIPEEEKQPESTSIPIKVSALQGDTELKSQERAS